MGAESDPGSNTIIRPRFQHNISDFFSTVIIPFCFGEH